MTAHFFFSGEAPTLPGTLVRVTEMAMHLKLNFQCLSFPRPPPPSSPCSIFETHDHLLPYPTLPYPLQQLLDAHRNNHGGSRPKKKEGEEEREPERERERELEPATRVCCRSYVCGLAAGAGARRDSSHPEKLLRRREQRRESILGLRRDCAGSTPLHMCVCVLSVWIRLALLRLRREPARTTTVS